MKRPAPAAIRRQSLRLLGLLALSNTAQAEPVEIAWDTDGRFERQLSVAPKSSVDGTLDVSRDNDYCWMWANVSTPPVAVRVQLVRLAAQWESGL